MWTAATRETALDRATGAPMAIDKSIHEGETATYRRTFTGEDVAAFAELSNDGANTSN